MAVEEIIVGLRGAGWETFSEYIHGSHWSAAIRSASTEQLIGAVSELQLEDDKLEAAIKSFDLRFKKSLYYSPSGVYDTNPSMSANEYEKSLEAVTRLIGSIKEFNLRYLLFETLNSALRARPFEDLSASSLGILIQGLKEEPKIAVLSAEVLGGVGENKGSQMTYLSQVIPALEECAERIRKHQNSAENRGKILDSIDRIKYGENRTNTEYRRYLGDGELLHVPMFSSRPVPNEPKRFKMKENV